MKKVFLSLILIFFGISLFANSSANLSSDGNDVVFLKNGTKVEGTILEQTDAFVKIVAYQQGEVTINRTDIDRIVTQIADGGYNYTISTAFPTQQKVESPAVVSTLPPTSGTSTPKTPLTTFKSAPKRFLPDDVYDDLSYGYIVSNFYLEGRLGLGSGIAYCENMPYSITDSYNHPGTMGRSYGNFSLAGGMIAFLGNHFGFDMNLGYTHELGMATYRDEFATMGLSNPILRMNFFDFYFGFLLGHRLRLGVTCAVGGARSNGDDWADHDKPNYNSPIIFDDDMDAGSDFAFRWGVNLSYFFTPRFGFTVFGRYCDVSNRYTYRQPYPLYDIYVDNNSKHMSLGVELNFRLQPKCYNVKEVLSYENHGSYAIERSRVWKDCE